MANRYWVGGTGNWSDTARWSTSSGGSSGASVPTSADDVFFDNNSTTTTFTVTIDTASAVCKSFDASGITIAGDKMTLTGTASVGLLQVNGNWTNPATSFFGWTTWTTAQVTFTATATITTNAVTFAPTIIINGSGITVTLGGAITVTGTIQLSNGTLDTSSTNSYSLTSAGIGIGNNANTRSLNLNGSSITLTGTTPFTDNSTGSFFTLNAGTSTITCSNASPTFAGGGKTFYNVTFSSTAIVAAAITGSNTFNNLTIAARASAGLSQVSIASGSTQTINGTLTVNSGASATPSIRCRINSSVFTTTTINAAAVSLTNVDFSGIVAAGAASPFTGTSIGNASNNTNITFTAAKTVYWSQAAGGNWTGNNWATSSGGTPAVANLPIAQDTVYIDNAGLTTGNSISANTFYYGTVISTRTNAWTFACTTASMFFIGDLTLDANATITSTTANFLMYNITGTQTLTLPVSSEINIASASNILRLSGNTTITNTKTFQLQQGTLDLTNNGAGNYSFSMGTFSSSNSNTRAITFGASGYINLTAFGTGTTNILVMNTVTGFSYTGTPKVTISGAGTSGNARQLIFQTGATENNSLNYFVNNGSDQIILQSFYCKNLDFTGFSGSVSDNNKNIYGNLVLSSTMTYSNSTGITSFIASSGTQTLTTNGTTLDAPLTQNNSGATLQLIDNLTMGSTRTFTLTAGTLNLNDKTLSAFNLLSTSSTTTRGISFGTGNIELVGSGTVTLANIQGNSSLWTNTGSKTINLTGGGTTGTRSFNCADLGASNVFNINIISGSDTFSNAATYFGNIDFTGFTGSWASSFRYVYGNLIFSPTMSVLGTGPLQTISSGTQVITSNSNPNISCPISCLGTGAVQLYDNLITSSSITHTNGTINLNNKTFTAGAFSSTGTTTRGITFGSSGKLAISGNFTTSGSGLTTSGTGTISMTSASAKTFAGGGFSYPVISQDGSGALTITGSNTFNDITNTTQPATVTFEAGTNTSVSNFSLSGTAGNLITINSSTPGSRFTLTKI